jgi:hypothetical protein
MKNLNILIAVLTLLGFVESVKAESKESLGVSNRVPNNAFTTGEKVSYKIKYSLYFNFSVGEVDFELKPDITTIKGAKCYHAVAKGKTYGFYDAFFKVRDVYEAYIQTDNMLPLIAKRDVQEGNFKFTENVTFNHDKGTLITPKGNKKMPIGTMDVLTTLYYARCFDFSKLKPGDKEMMNMFIDDSTFYIGFKYIGKERIKTEAGKFNCIKLQPVLVQGRVFKSEDQMTLYITDDKNHIPVRVESGISVGSIKADLINYSNLKNELSSKL